VTYVPARNTIFLSFALAWAEVLESSHIFIGVNALDYSGYPDCRPEFIEAYTQLHQQGHAHSLECWQGRRLVGGIYGVTIGGLFAGESMFHRVSDASKVALFHMIEHLRRRGFVLFDIQMLTPITAQLGGITLPRAEYLSRLAQAVTQPVAF